MTNVETNRIRDVIDQWATRRAVGLFLNLGCDVDDPRTWDDDEFPIARLDIRDSDGYTDERGWECYAIVDVFTPSRRFPMFENIPYCDNLLFRIHGGDGTLDLYGDFDKSMKLPNENELKYSELFRRTAEFMGQFSAQFLVGVTSGGGDEDDDEDDGEPRQFFYYRDEVSLLNVDFGPELVDEMFERGVWAMRLMSVVVKRLETNSLDDVLAGLEPFFRLPEGHREFSFCDW